MGLTLGLNIVQSYPLTNNSTANYCNFKEESFVIPRNGINIVNFTVKIAKDVPKKFVEQTNKPNDLVIDEPTEKHPSTASEFSEILSDDSDDEELESGFCDTPQPDVSTCHTTLELFNTGVRYWLCHSPRSKCSLEEFDTFATNVLPATFLWFLHECSRIVQVPARDLYTNIVSMEENHMHIINKAHVFIYCSPTKGTKRTRK